MPSQHHPEHHHPHPLPLLAKSNSFLEWWTFFFDHQYYGRSRNPPPHLHQATSLPSSSFSSSFVFLRSHLLWWLAHRSQSTCQPLVLRLGWPHRRRGCRQGWLLPLWSRGAAIIRRDTTVDHHGNRVGSGYYSAWLSPNLSCEPVTLPQCR